MAEKRREEEQVRVGDHSPSCGPLVSQVVGEPQHRRYAGGDKLPLKVYERVGRPPEAHRQGTSVRQRRKHLCCVRPLIHEAIVRKNDFRQPVRKSLQN